jgi:signal transduction histidine kinase
MKNRNSLRSRWLSNTVIVFCILGLICVILIGITFTVYYYANMRADMKARAAQASQFFSSYVGQSYDDYYQSCVNYAKNYELSANMELQFINAEGVLVASSYGHWAGSSPSTAEIFSAMTRRESDDFVGINPDTGEHIIAVSCPMIYSNGKVVGVLRYVTSTRLVNLQIVYILMAAVGVFALLLLVLILSSTHYIRSIVVPVGEITQKAKKIANGSYGTQIQKTYNDEIGELVDTINDMSIKISRNEKMQADFISSLSHELRTPLTAINGWSETLLGDENLDEQTARGMKIISKESERLTEMVLSLLDFSRLQDNRLTLNVEEADIRSEFEDTVYMYSSRLAQDGMKLEYLDNDDDIPMIHCDCKRLRQVFLNILDNAAKHGREGGRIEASISHEKGMVVVRIRDFGPGIPEAELPLVKKKFYKGSSKNRGTGIGLAVSDEIVDMHGGTLTLENASGGGTLVTVCLPDSQ